MCGHLLVTLGKADWDLAAECTSACGGSSLTNSYNNKKHIYEPTRSSCHLTAKKKKKQELVSPPFTCFMYLVCLSL